MTEQAIVRTALKIDNAVERDAYLDSVCGRDSLLRERLDALIRTHGDAAALSSSRAPEANQFTVLKPEHEADPEAESIIDDEVLAFLERSTEPGSLGRLDHFEILKVVGKGGMGVVFKARDTRLQCIVAIKVLARAPRGQRRRGSGSSAKPAPSRRCATSTW